MQTYTIQCGYNAAYANVVTVTAETLKEACDAAIEQANDDSCWKALDHVGDTYIDAIAEGEVDCPWLNHTTSPVPIPDGFTEQETYGGHRFTKEEQATVLAALRYWQRHVAHGDAATIYSNAPAGEREMFDQESDLMPLTADQIDALCEKLNS